MTAPGPADTIEDEVTRADPYWPAQLAVVAALVLYVLLPGKLTLGPDWVIPAAEGALLVGLAVVTPYGGGAESPWRRGVAMTLAGVAAAANLVSLGLLVHFVVRSGQAKGYELILSGMQIWGTSVLIFAVTYWDLDRGGPRERRRRTPPARPDFLFPQADLDEFAGWTPNFVDYLYTSFTNSTAFSPTDVMPLTARAKLLMMVQGLAALVTIGIVVARAVGVLG